jgi:hypothetical protein
MIIVSSSFSSTPPEETAHGDSTDNSNNKNTSINNILSLRTIITSLIFIGLTMKHYFQNRST